MQPGSIDSEAGIFASTFDKSGSRLLTCEADKTIKIYKEDENAVSFQLLFQGFLAWLLKITHDISADIRRKCYVRDIFYIN